MHNELYNVNFNIDTYVECACMYSYPPSLQSHVYICCLMVYMRNILLFVLHCLINSKDPIGVKTCQLYNYTCYLCVYYALCFQ